MKRKINVVFFDAGNTILFINFKVIKKILEENGIKTSLTDLKESELKWRTSLEENIEEFQHLKDKEILPFYFSLILKSMNLDKETEEHVVSEIIKRHKKKMLWSIFPSSVYKVIKELRKRDYLVGIISNSDGRLVNQLKSMKIWELFDTVVDSREVGVEKPDPEIFKIALNRLNAQPEEAIYIGDIYSIDIKPAQRIGMKAILFDPGDFFGHLHCPRIKRIKDVFDFLE